MKKKQPPSLLGPGPAHNATREKQFPFINTNARQARSSQPANPIPVAKIPSSTCNSLNCGIADVLTQSDAELAILKQRREKPRTLKQGMMQELLTRRTRLV